MPAPHSEPPKTNKNMKPSQKPFWTLLAALLLLAGQAQAALYLENFSAVNTAIPDGSPICVALGGAVSDIPAGETVEGWAVSLDLRGGYNANLYAYLVGPNGTLVVLMNQPGVSPATLFGAGGAGMAITLLDGTSDHGSI